MREIKFRAVHYGFNEKFSHFSYWGRIDRNGNTTCNTNTFFSPAKTTNTYIKHDEQYTGLKDKNGKEIYEGDIVQPYHNTMKAPIQIVKYHEHSFYMFDIGDINNDGPIWYYVVEIIGNVHENPDLLKESPA